MLPEVSALKWLGDLAEVLRGVEGGSLADGDYRWHTGWHQLSKTGT